MLPFPLSSIFCILYTVWLFLFSAMTGTLWLQSSLTNLERTIVYYFKQTTILDSSSLFLAQNSYFSVSYNQVEQK